jgi:hypothetical protein
MRKFFHWDGTYAAFERVGRLFRPDGSYFAWIDNDGARVWRADGAYLGEIVDDNYILRNTQQAPPVSRGPRIPPVPPIAPARPIDRTARPPRLSWTDVL